MKTKIAILATTAGLVGAIQASLAARFPNADIVTINKIGERPADATLATLGLPAYIPGNEGVKILSFGSKMVQGMTTEDRSAQWKVLRDPNASVEEVLEELGNFTEYSVIQGRVLMEAKSAVVDVKLQISEATTDEQRLAAYKAGFETLSKLLG